MRIDSIRLLNYRRFSDLTLNFQEGMNVIAGLNGSGKTSILTALCASFYGYYTRLHVSSFRLTDEDGWVRLVATNDLGRIRFEPQYPAGITVQGTVKGEALTWKIEKESELSHLSGSGMLVRLPGDYYMSDAGGETGRATLPLLLFYRANRKWQDSKSSEVEAVMQKNSRMDAYASYWNASVDSAAFQLWVVARSLERYQMAAESGRHFDQIADDELNLVNSAIARIISGAKGLRFDLRQKRLFLEWNGTEQPSPFDNLSDGQKVMIGLVADIARRMCLLNPHLGVDSLRETPGVILIDELDLHLHPVWQRAIAHGLPEAFPAVQFIAASHSPQVLGELRPEQIILLHGEHGDHPQASYGLDSSRILEEVMDAPVRTEAVEAKLEEISALIESGHLADARQKIAELEIQAPSLPELIRASALIKRKEVIGR